LDYTDKSDSVREKSSYTVHDMYNSMSYNSNKVEQANLEFHQSASETFH